MTAKMHLKNHMNWLDVKNDENCSSLKLIPHTFGDIPKFGVQCVSGTKALCSNCKKEHQVACLNGGGLKSDQCTKHWKS